MKEKEEVIQIFQLYVEWHYIITCPLINEEQLKRSDVVLKKFNAAVQFFRPFTSKHGFAFPKYHLLQEYSAKIPRLGATQNTDVSLFESSHHDLVKTFVGNTNGHNTEKQVCRLTYH